MKTFRNLLVYAKKKTNNKPNDSPSARVIVSYKSAYSAFCFLLTERQRNNKANDSPSARVNVSIGSYFNYQYIQIVVGPMGLLLFK